MFENEILDYEKISEKIQLMFEMDKSPVAVKLYENEDDVKEILQKDEGNERHCGMVYDVAENKSTYYATLDEMACSNGAIALGLLESKLIEGIPKIDSIIKAVAYLPLEKSQLNLIQL